MYKIGISITDRNKLALDKYGGWRMSQLKYFSILYKMYERSERSLEDFFTYA